MRQADGLLNQVRFLVGSPLQWEVDSKFPFFSNGKLIEYHGNQYRVPNQIAEIYSVLQDHNLSSEDCIRALTGLVSAPSAKAPIQQLYARIQQVLEGQHDYLPSLPPNKQNTLRH